MLKKLKICVLGADGQLGQEFRYLASSYEFLAFDFYSKKLLNIEDKTALKDILNSENFDYVFNCAAYTAVDKAESEVEKCYAINTQACETIVDTLSGLQTRLVHFSSDYVYHTYSGFPLTENDVTSPKGVYAKSKLEGEQIIRKSKTPSLILRTSWVFSSFGHNFVKTMLRLGSEKSVISVVNDQFGAPTYARHLAVAVLDIITTIETNPNLIHAFNETYNFANEGFVSWYDIAVRIMAEGGLECAVNPISTQEYPSRAERPSWSVLSKNKIKERFSLEIPHWFRALKECISEIKAQTQ